MNARHTRLRAALHTLKGNTMTDRYTMPDTAQARVDEMPETVLVKYPDGTEEHAPLIGRALKFPMIRLRDGGTCEVARQTVLDTQRAGRPIIV